MSKSMIQDNVISVFIIYWEDNMMLIHTCYGEYLDYWISSIIYKPGQCDNFSSVWLLSCDLSTIAALYSGPFTYRMFIFRYFFYSTFAGNNQGYLFEHAIC